MAPSKTARPSTARSRRAGSAVTSATATRPAGRPRSTGAPAAAAEPAAARHSLLLSEAAWLFGKKGSDKTSMRDIAAAHGILPGSLDYHFRSKDELFVAVYAAGIDKIIDAVERATRDEADP